jgi:hypothetical protein
VDPLLLGKSSGPGTSGSVARNSDHWTTEAVVSVFRNAIETKPETSGNKRQSEFCFCSAWLNLSL